MRTSLQQTIKASQKTILSYTLTGLTATLLIGIGAFFFFNMGMGKMSYAATESDPPIIVSKASGNWNAAASWDLNRRPQNGDRVIVKKDHTININSNTTFNGDIIVNGELRVENARLKMDANSRIAVNVGGQINFSPMQTKYLAFIPYNEPSGYITIGGSESSEILWGFPRSTYIPHGNGGTIVTSPTQGEASFGPDAASLLPIELISFTGDMTKDEEVLLSWATAAEKGNDFFTIERSLDGQNFFVLDTISGAGNSNKRIDYTYTDPYPASGYNYYRLKQTDFDGKFEHFNVVAVINDKAEPQLSQVSIGPNPYYEHFEVSFHSMDNGMVHLKLMDMQGRTIFNMSMEAEKGTNSFIYDDDHQLQPGIYLFTIVQKGTPAQTFRVVKAS